MFKVLIKKLFPPKKSVYTIDTTGDGKADSLQIKVINLIIPFSVPKNVELGNFDLKSIDINNFDLSEYATLYLDDNPIKFSKDSINIEKLKSQFTIYHKGESFNLDDILDGKFSGRMIAFGDTISVLFKLDADILKNLVAGNHTFKIESELVSNFIIDFELDETNMNLNLDPKNM
ncbi:MAG: hypothetical protein ACW98D_11930 [Promethearchaeota archaeon]